MSAGEANRRLEDLSRLVGDWLWETDRDQGLVYLSNRVMEILGFHPEELLGKKLEDFGEFALMPNCMMRRWRKTVKWTRERW